jgi:glyoxylase-like metal-dependent hydrolase (beta-lactamase superfamily II)
MTMLTRRSLLTATAAVALAPLLPFSRADAAAPLAGKQAPGFYRYKVGTIECTSVNDGVQTYPIGDGFVRNASKDQLIAAAEAAYFPQGKFNCQFNFQIVNTGTKLVLIDTGWGPGPDPTVGLLTTNMQAAGIDPKSIDMVLISHLHPDHVSGIRAADGSLAFPNAEIKVPAKDWAFWMNDDNMAKAPEGMAKDFFANNRRVFKGIENRVSHYEWGQELAPGIIALDVSGHTPGHTAFAIASGGARVLFQGDLTNIPEFFVRHPEWHVAFDIDADKAEAARRKFYDMAMAEKAPVIGAHFPFPAIGHVEKDGAGYRLVPVAWQPLL